MELKMSPYQLPEAISFNFDELKAGLMEKCKDYEAMVYSEEQISAAKADRATLNKLKKALNDERLKREREYMQPFMQFKAQVAEIISIIDQPVQAIDKQIKSFEDQKKAEKQRQIEAYWQEMLQADKVPAGICFSHVFHEKMLNASVSMKSIQADIDAMLARFAGDLAVIRALPDYAFEAEQAYLSTLDLAKALNEANRLREAAERKAEHEAEKPQPAAYTPMDENGLPKQWLSFKALLSVDDALALKAFFEARKIEFQAL